MDQKKTGEFLKSLRREKGLTQEQLGERFYVSSRTISRWETGANMPDVAMLLELADFYGVDIREIIDGERKLTVTETKETLLKVAEYATEGEKQSRSKVVYVALGVCIALLICTFLFSGGFTGVLYGIVPAAVCDHILALAYGVAVCLLIFYLRVRMWREKPAYEPEKTVAAAVVSKELRAGTRETGRSVMGYSFAVTFLTEDGQTLELYTSEIEFGGLKESMRGVLTYRGRYFVSFQDVE